MSEGKLNNLMDTTMEKIKQMVDVNTVVGDAVTTPDGTVVIPVSKVSYGFASGGADLPSKAAPSKELFGGGSGAGVTITPVAFLVIGGGNVRVMQIEPYFSSIDRALEKIPEVVDMVKGFVSRDKKDEEAAEE